MIFDENRLPAVNSREISSLFVSFEKAAKFLSSTANYKWRFMGKDDQSNNRKRHPIIIVIDSIMMNYSIILLEPFCSK